jgi:hypothetical protein
MKNICFSVYFSNLITHGARIKISAPALQHCLYYLCVEAGQVYIHILCSEVQPQGWPHPSSFQVEAEAAPKGDVLWEGQLRSLKTIVADAL